MKTLLKNGTIYDGSGAAPYVGDVLFEGDTILEVGKNISALVITVVFPEWYARLTAEKIVRKMSGATADRYEIPQRGYLRPGYKADVTMLNLDAMRVDETKPDRRPTGIVHVFVNGRPVMKDGAYLGAQAGELVLKK